MMDVKFDKSTDEKKGMGSLIILIGIIVLSLLLLGFGVEKMLQARASLMSAHDEYEKAQSEAAAIPKAERDLNNALQKWNDDKRYLWRSAETGIMFKDVEDAAKNHGVQLISMEPQNSIKSFYRGHLIAVPVKISFKGTFPGVLSAVADIEKLASPGEVRQFNISVPQNSQQTDAVGTVDAKLEAVFYSLNPPEMFGKVNGSSGRYDPFFPLIIPEQNQQPKDATKANTPSNTSNFFDQIFNMIFGTENKNNTSNTPSNTSSNSQSNKPNNTTNNTPNTSSKSN
ncbi:type 4a pilus biogenesis protein PilO [Aceticella autotrophica]|uniref:Type 4a pilus biogenesis protein PilO n=1 Tax=Aceticella autotrophica TaxID=2755338 RepID=A0A975AX18_9THEO|nr:type 4a pilus biogenesis protein PilO [Aceticella autotrophica]QSZ28035.1 type 4a pilus biogenesis protein PilO [Aceticella autotrophica]